MLNRQLSSRGNTRRVPPRFTLVDPQTPPKTLRFSSKFKVFVCLTVRNHAFATLPHMANSSLRARGIPSRSPGALKGIKNTPHAPQKHMRGAYIFICGCLAVHPIAGAEPASVGSRGFNSGYSQSYLITTARPPPSRHSPAHQCPQYGCAPSDPASTTDADAATNQPPPGYPSPPGRPAPGS